MSHHCVILKRDDFICRKIYRSACFIVPVVVFPLLYNIPKAFELSVDTSVTPPLFQPTELRKNKLYVMVYLVFLNFIVQILVPFTTLIVVNYRTYLTIKESEQNLASGNFSIQFKSSPRFRYTNPSSHSKSFLPISTPSSHLLLGALIQQRRPLMTTGVTALNKDLFSCVASSLTSAVPSCRRHRPTRRRRCAEGRWF